MKRCCCKKRRSKRRLAVNQPQVVQSDERLQNDFDVREKRISIVFKVIYVIAAFFASAVIAISSNFGNGLTKIYIVYVCVASFLLRVLYKLLVYIFDELKCMRIFSVDKAGKDELNIIGQMAKTEKDYFRIFGSFYISGIACIVIGIALILVREYFTKTVFLGMFIIFGTIGAIIRTDNTNVRIWQDIHDISWVLAVISILSAMAFNG